MAKYDFVHFDRKKRAEVEQKLADLDRLESDLKEWHKTKRGRPPTTTMFIANARQHLKGIRDGSN